MAVLAMSSEHRNGASLYDQNGIPTWLLEMKGMETSTGPSIGVLFRYDIIADNPLNHCIN